MEKLAFIITQMSCLLDMYEYVDEKKINSEKNIEW